MSGDIADLALVRCTDEYEPTLPPGIFNPKMDGHPPDTGDKPDSDVDWVPGCGRASALDFTITEGLSFHDADRDQGKSCQIHRPKGPDARIEDNDRPTGS